jgi:hypothetical protein
MQDAGTDTADASADGLEPYTRPTYQKLSETGLYANIGTMAIAAGALPFQPAHQLWSDAADKRRWVQLPPGSKIDTSDMDRWQFPIGTKVWKEFARGGTLLETRLIERYGPGAEDYYMMAFIWATDRSDATAAPDGAANVNGTTHDVPLSDQCGSCHRGERGRILGVSAIQMSHTGSGLNLAGLVASNRLSDPPPAGTSYPVPGDATTAAALGYLHANCGHCHVANTAAYHDTKMLMRLSVTERVASETEVYRSLVGQTLDYWVKPPYTHRVVAGQPAESAIIGRMMARGSKDQMPPLASEVADATAITAISAWITALQ